MKKDKYRQARGTFCLNLEILSTQAAGPPVNSLHYFDDLQGSSPYCYPMCRMSPTQ